jgi:trk system potassium uptake protein TrkA
VATFLESDIEVNEFAIEAGSAAAGALVADLHLPHSVLLGAVTRTDGTSQIVRGHTRLEADDKVVVFSRPDSLGVTRKAFSA